MIIFQDRKQSATSITDGLLKLLKQEGPKTWFVFYEGALNVFMASNVVMKQKHDPDKHQIGLYHDVF